MKKIIFSFVLAIGAATCMHAQGSFYGIDPNKVVELVGQSQKMPKDNALLIVDQTMQVMSTTPKGYRKALDLLLPRLSDPTDSLHNEDIYISLLKHAATSDVLSSNEKMRPQALLESAMKNRIGTKAADVDYVTSNGTSANLLNNDNRLTLVYFNDPDCDACAKAKENLAASSAIKQAVEAGLLKVVAMNNEKLWKKTQFPDWVVNGWNKSQSINNGSYDLPTLPVFFLLGRDNTVLLKNEASLKRMEKAVTLAAMSTDSTTEDLINLLFIK